VTFKASADHLSFSQLDDRIKLIRREVLNRPEGLIAAVYPMNAAIDARG